MEKFITISDSLKVVENVCKVAKDIHAPVCVQNRGQWNNLNHIEIYNSGDHLVKNVTIQIVDLPADDCYWENPGNSDKQILVIPYVEPRNHMVQELMYAYCGCNTDVQLHITWEDRLGIKHSDFQYLHLDGM